MTPDIEGAALVLFGFLWLLAVARNFQLTEQRDKATLAQWRAEALVVEAARQNSDLRDQLAVAESRSNVPDTFGGAS